MSVYSDPFGFLFIHIPKNAGSTFIRNLETQCPDKSIVGFEQVNEELGYERDPALGNHFTYRMITKLVDEHHLPINYRASYKFCVIRNPWERMVSLYEHRLRKIDRTTNGVPRNSEADKKLLRKGFAPWLLKTKNLSDVVLTKMPQVEWIRDSEGNVVCDRIVNIQSYDVEIREISEELKLPQVEMNRVNVSSKDSSKYASYYNRATRKHVEKYFAEDIDLFKFSFA